MRGEKATKPCDCCGEMATKYLSQSHGKGWYCSTSCSAKKQWERQWGANAKPDPLRGAKETRPCDECGTLATKRLSHVKEGQMWTCSRTCKAKRQAGDQIAAGTWTRPINTRKGKDVSCANCSKVFYLQPAQIKNGRRFCSKQCSDQGQRKTVIRKSCKWCNKPMELKPSKALYEHCSSACYGESKIKRPLGRMHNGRRAKMDNKGYVLLYEPDRAGGIHGWEYEHRLVAEAAVGRLLLSDEQVHHVNGVKNDNRPENLQVLSQVEHAAISRRDYADEVRKTKADLEEYKWRFGVLEKEN